MPTLDVEMRATRAYVAGFGTAGSLVAGGAVSGVLGATGAATGSLLTGAGKLLSGGK
jgi:hypothetical protein